LPNRLFLADPLVFPYSLFNLTGSKMRLGLSAKARYNLHIGEFFGGFTMKAETLGTVVAGALKLDQQLDWPDQSRVRVAVESLEAWQTRLREGWKAWKMFSDEHPIHAGGLRYSRDELHERH
jgi:hypothetical protein